MCEVPGVYPPSPRTSKKKGKGEGAPATCWVFFFLLLFLVRVQEMSLVTLRALMSRVDTGGTDSKQGTRVLYEIRREVLCIYHAGLHDMGDVTHVYAEFLSHHCRKLLACTLTVQFFTRACERYKRLAQSLICAFALLDYLKIGLSSLKDIATATFYAEYVAGAVPLVSAFLDTAVGQLRAHITHDAATDERTLESVASLCRVLHKIDAHAAAPIFRGVFTALFLGYSVPNNEGMALSAQLALLQRATRLEARLRAAMFLEEKVPMATVEKVFSPCLQAMPVIALTGTPADLTLLAGVLAEVENCPLLRGAIYHRAQVSVKARLDQEKGRDTCFVASAFIRVVASCTQRTALQCMFRQALANDATGMAAILDFVFHTPTRRLHELGDGLVCLHALFEQPTFADAYVGYLRASLHAGRTGADAEHERWRVVRGAHGSTRHGAVDDFLRSCHQMTHGATTLNVLKARPFDALCLLRRAGKNASDPLSTSAVPAHARKSIARLLVEHDGKGRPPGRTHTQLDLTGGSATVAFQCGATSVDIVCSTMQMMLLFLFQHDFTGALTYKHIRSRFPDMGDDHGTLGRHLLSLAHPRVKILLKCPNSSRLGPADTFCVNVQLLRRSTQAVLRVPLLEMSRPATVGARQRHTFERVDCAIVACVKQMRTVAHNDLVKLIQTRLLVPSARSIICRIESLITRGYMARDSNRRHVYLYCTSADQG